MITVRVDSGVDGAAYQAGEGEDVNLALTQAEADELHALLKWARTKLAYQGPSTEATLIDATMDALYRSLPELQVERTDKANTNKENE